MLHQLILLGALQRFGIRSVIVRQQMQFFSGNLLTKMAPYVTSFLAGIKHLPPKLIRIKVKYQHCEAVQVQVVLNF
jgi:hypothetical protein